MVLWFFLLTAVEGRIMSNLIPGNQKHLTLKDRLFIEESLERNLSFKEIARYLCKDPTTISKEVKAHRKHEPHFTERLFYNAKNFCTHRFRCRKSNVCRKIELCGVKCASCPTCNQACPDFEREHCRRLQKAPYVCNVCDKKGVRCTIADRFRYNARIADREYNERLRESRTGKNLSRHDLREKDKIISPLIYQGQSPYQIVTNHPELEMSVRSLYSYIEMGVFCSRNVDLKRKVKFKPRKCHKSQIRERAVFVGRTYGDFTRLELTSFAEMDTVHSSRESKRVLLTFFLTKEKLFLAFLINRCTPGAVRLVFDRLEKNSIPLGFCPCSNIS